MPTATLKRPFPFITAALASLPALALLGFLYDMDFLTNGATENTTLFIGAIIVILGGGALGLFFGRMFVRAIDEEQTRIRAAFCGQLDEIIKPVNGALTGMDASTGQLNRLMEDHQERVGITASSLSKATETATIIASAIEEMNSSIHEISRQADEATQVAASAVENAESVDQSITHLADRADQIGSIVSLIQAIAERTNLLALNASIEAARAGQSGRGFAVVAGEVKGLALQTAEAIGQIEKQIADMRAAALGTKERMTSIRAVNERINTVTAEIKTALQQQAAATHEIANGALQTTQTATAANDHVAHLLVTIEETHRIVEAAQGQAEELRRQSGMIETVVANFK